MTSPLPPRISLWVWMSGEGGEGAIDLLGEHGAGQFVRECQRRERKLLRGSAAQRLGKSFGGAAKKHNFARAAVARLTKPAGKLRRGLMFPRVIEQDHGRGGIERELAQGRGGIYAQLGHFHFGETADTRYIIVYERPNFQAARFPEHD